MSSIVSLPFSTFCFFPCTRKNLQGLTCPCFMTWVLASSAWSKQTHFVCIFIRNLTRCIDLSFSCILAIHNKSSAIMMRRIVNGIDINKILSSLFPYTYTFPLLKVAKLTCLFPVGIVNTVYVQITQQIMIYKPNFQGLLFYFTDFYPQDWNACSRHLNLLQR